MIENCARAGINTVKYNMTILGVVRTEPTPGRGGSKYSTFEYNRARENATFADSRPGVERGDLGADQLFSEACNPGRRAE